MGKAWTMIASIIANELRHVALPEKMPMKVSIVLEYTETTVRHEFAPDMNQLVMREEQK